MRMVTGVLESIGALLVAMMAIYLVVAFVLVYFAADAQSRRTGSRDEGLGLRIVTSFLLTLTFQTALAGLALLLAGLLDGQDEFMVRMGLGLLLGSVVSSILPFIVHKTRAPALSAGAPDMVRRKTVGINAIITGAVSTAGLMGICVTLTMEFDMNAAAVAVVMVYTAGAILTLISLGKARSVA